MRHSWPNSLIGSDHNMSHMSPTIGGLPESVQLQDALDNVTGADGKKSGNVKWLTLRISSIICSSGDIPPCTQKYRLSTIVTRGSAKE